MDLEAKSPRMVSQLSPKPALEIHTILLSAYCARASSSFIKKLGVQPTDPNLRSIIYNSQDEENNPPKMLCGIPKNKNPINKSYFIDDTAKLRKNSDYRKHH